VQRRDGAAVEGEEWLREARELYATAAEMYEILPDVSRPPRQFETKTNADLAAIKERRFTNRRAFTGSDEGGLESAPP
jgi:hypothetical protein